jgi:hypothetical protein
MSRANRRALDGATTIDPATLPGLELSLWSTNVVGTNGTGAATWPDTSGNARDATQATSGQRPTITDAASLNGKRMLLYDGVDDQMAGTFPATPTGIPNTDGYTIYLYFQEASLTTGGFNSQLVFGGGLELVARTATIGGYPSDQHYGIAFSKASLGNTALGFQTFTGVWTTGGSPVMQGFVNGAQSGADQTWNNATLGNGYTVGSNASGNVSLQGYYGAVHVFSHAHSTATRTAVEAYIKNFFES